MRSLLYILKRRGSTVVAGLNETGHRAAPPLCTQLILPFPYRHRANHTHETHQIRRKTSLSESYVSVLMTKPISKQEPDRRSGGGVGGVRTRPSVTDEEWSRSQSRRQSNRLPRARVTQVGRPNGWWSNRFSPERAKRKAVTTTAGAQV